jgi:hypothetical protein
MQIMSQPIECPVDFIKVNENQIRITASLIFFLSCIYLVFPHFLLAFFLLVDFLIRGFLNPKYSFLNFFSKRIVQSFDIKNKPTDRGAKRFAAKIGFVFATIIFLLNAFNFIEFSIYTAVIIVVFSFLESALGFCAGCYMYTFLKKLSIIPSAEN